MTDRTDHQNVGGGRSLWELFEQRVATTPDASAVVTPNDTLTFRELHDRALSVAAGLFRWGIGPDTVVSWQLPTRTDTVALALALVRLGAIQNPLLPMLRAAEVEFIARQCGAEVLIVASEWNGFDFGAMARDVASRVAGLDVAVLDDELPVGDPSELPDAPTSDDVVRWLYYTSGTTSEPKGARHTDAGVVAAAHCQCSHLEIVERDRMACVFPFTHIAGAVYIASMTETGCSMVVLEAFTAESPGVLADLELTLVGAGTPFHQAYLAYQEAHPDRAPLFPRARAFLGGGAPKPPSLHYRVKDELGGVGIVSGYGMTEAPILTMGHLTDVDEELAHAEGAPGPGVALRFLDRHGNDVDAETGGELVVRAPQMMKGYVDESLDADAFVDGWFRTGDLGRLTQAGNLVISGRAKDIIIRNMENISAKEVEDLLVEHSAIADAAVIGLPDGRTGERVCAVVVVRDGAQAPTKRELAEHVRGRGLAVQKTPEQVEVVDSLPRNASGKVQKNLLRDRYTD